METSEVELAEELINVLSSIVVLLLLDLDYPFLLLYDGLFHEVLF